MRTKKKKKKKLMKTENYQMCMRSFYIFTMCFGQV